MLSDLFRPYIGHAGDLTYQDERALQQCAKKAAYGVAAGGALYALPRLGYLMWGTPRLPRVTGLFFPICGLVFGWVKCLEEDLSKLPVTSKLRKQFVRQLP